MAVESEGETTDEECVTPPKTVTFNMTLQVPQIQEPQIRLVHPPFLLIPPVQVPRRRHSWFSG